jgi:PQQ-dependent catabolism-associated beta-propeller protein
MNDPSRRKLVAAMCLAGGLAAAGCGTKGPAKTTADQSPRSAVRVYVSNERSNDISVVDAGTQTELGRIPVGKRPRGILVSRDNQTVYVALSGSPIAGPHVKDEDLPPADKRADGIAMVDTTTGRFLGKFNSGSDPEQFSLSGDEQYLFVANVDDGLTSVIHLPGRKFVARHKTGSEPGGVTTSPDGSVVYVTSENTNEVYAIDGRSRELAGAIKVGSRPRCVAFLPDGSKAYVTCENAAEVDVIDVATDKVVKQIIAPGDMIHPMGVVCSPDGKRAYVTTGRGKSVLVIDAAKDEVIATIPDVGERPWGIGITPGGRTLYTANGPSNDVSVIDVATLTVTKRIPAGTSPWGIAVSH